MSSLTPHITQLPPSEAYENLRAQISSRAWDDFQYLPHAQSLKILRTSAKREGGHVSIRIGTIKLVIDNTGKKVVDKRGKTGQTDHTDQPDMILDVYANIYSKQIPTDAKSVPAMTYHCYLPNGRRITLGRKDFPQIKYTQPFSDLSSMQGSHRQHAECLIRFYYMEAGFVTILYKVSQLELQGVCISIARRAKPRGEAPKRTRVDDEITASLKRMRLDEDEEHVEKPAPKRPETMDTVARILQTLTHRPRNQELTQEVTWEPQFDPMEMDLVQRPRNPEDDQN